MLNESVTNSDLRKRRVTRARTIIALTLASAIGPQTPAEVSAEEVRPTGRTQDVASIRVSEVEIPFSSFASLEARRTLADLLNAPPAPDFRRDIEGARRFYGKFNDTRLAEMRSLYAVTIRAESIGGVRTDVVIPKQGVAASNRDRVLISLHGGGFLWGAGSGALVEAIPIAATSKIKVVAVDYRMAPEHRFPAASEDVAAVYRALLKSYKAESIGIYGCSAGGVLTAQAVAWFATHGLPLPGAIVTLCATGAELHGDSVYVGPLLTGKQPTGHKGERLHHLVSDLPYFEGVDPQDPLVFPIATPELLAKFPPTLLIAGSRDYAASSLTVMHRRLREAGVDAELFLFDGLWHAFFIFPALPESQETYSIVGRFFDAHLGSRLENAR